MLYILYGLAFVGGMVLVNIAFAIHWILGAIATVFCIGKLFSTIMSDCSCED